MIPKFYLILDRMIKPRTLQVRHFLCLSQILYREGFIFGMLESRSGGANMTDRGLPELCL
jgi:hypothetical protein